ncbi:MAG: site-2 protease family protein [Clostridiales bacterium]|nr:site-2 protease family protein [Clostridiales bacterium]
MLIQILRNAGNYTVPQLILMVVVMLFALTISFSFHEFMHAVTADWLGDDTPRLLGRVTLNPMAHLDPVGTLLLLVAGFGWGKPVSYNPNKLTRFKSKRLMNIMVSLAGVTGNLFVALISMIIISVIMRTTGFATRNPVSEALYYVSAGLIGGYGVPPYAAVFCFLFYYTFLFSMGLFAFNLIPIPPLDGYHVIEHLLPYKVMYSEGFRNFTRYGPMVLMFLILIGNFGSFDILGTVMSLIQMPFIFVINIIAGLIGIGG